MSNEALIWMFSKNEICGFSRSTVHRRSRFGGPLELDVEGIRFGDKALHRIAVLDPRDIVTLGTEWSYLEIPLVYGLHYDGCLMKYEMVSSSKIRVLEMRPKKSSADWPYTNYPPLLPFYPLMVCHREAATYEEFRKKAPSLPESLAADAVAIVPPPASIGVSLWGHMGDLEKATIVFEIDMPSKSVRSYNVCG